MLIIRESTTFLSLTKDLFIEEGFSQVSTILDIFRNDRESRQLRSTQTFVMHPNSNSKLQVAARYSEFSGLVRRVQTLKAWPRKRQAEQLAEAGFFSARKRHFTKKKKRFLKLQILSLIRFICLINHISFSQRRMTWCAVFSVG